MANMGRGYNGKFRDSKDKDKKGGGFALGVIMAILCFATEMWFPFLPLAALGFYRAWVHKNSRDVLEHCREYGNLMGMRETISVSELSETFGRSPEIVRRELKSKIAKDYFGKEAYLDVGRDMLCCPLPERAKRSTDTRWADVAMEVLRTLRGDPDTNPQAAADQCTQQKKAPVVTPEPEPKKPEPEPKKPEPEMQRTDMQTSVEPKPAQGASRPTAKSRIDYSEELERTLNELYDLNEKIQDVPVSDRIDRIGVLTGSIFRVVIEKPERESDVRKFMNYYLPTTLKLLKAYSLMEAQSYQGENIKESRKRIEETLDMLIVAFERLLDKLFRDDALDIATDIDVLKTMVAGDGLSESGQLHL